MIESLDGSLRPLSLRLRPSVGQYRVYSIQYKVYSIPCTVYSIQYTLYSIQYTVYSIQCTVYSIHYTVYNIQYTAAHHLSSYHLYIRSGRQTVMIRPPGISLFHGSSFAVSGERSVVLANFKICKLCNKGMFSIS